MSRRRLMIYKKKSEYEIITPCSDNSYMATYENAAVNGEFNIILETEVLDIDHLYWYLVSSETGNPTSGISCYGYEDSGFTSLEYVGVIGDHGYFRCVIIKDGKTIVPDGAIRFDSYASYITLMDSYNNDAMLSVDIS